MAEKIKVDDIVRSLVLDGKKPEDMIMIYGFVGESKEEDAITLYFDPALKSSVDIKESDILYHIKVTKSHTVIGGTILWVQNASSYLNKNTTHAQEEAQKFFQGEIYQQYANQN